VRVALVLGAGGATGHAFHAGVLSTLAERTGWDARTADLIVGTSAGSGVGAILRVGLSPQDLAARATGEPVSTDAAKLVSKLGAPATAFALDEQPTGSGAGPRRIAGPGVLSNAMRRPWTVRAGAVAAAMLPPGRRSTQPISRGIKAVHGPGWPDQPLWLCAVRSDDARRVVFGRDESPQADLGDAVAASCAIPGYFEPVEIDGVTYIDGGAHSPTNADVLNGESFDAIVVSSPMSVARNAVRPAADMAMRLMFHRFLSVELAALRRRGTKVLTFEPTVEDLSVMGINAMDWTRRPRVVRQVRESAAKRIDAKGWSRWTG